MTSGSANFRCLNTSEDVVRGEGSAGGVAADEFPFRKVLHLDKAIYFGFTLNKVVESDILEQVFEIAIEARYVGGEWGAVVVFFEDFVGGVSVEAHALNVYPGEGARLLLKDAKNIAVKARLVDAHHVRVSLAKIAGENEHIPDTFQVPKILRPSLDGGEIKVVDMTHFVGSECYLLVAVGW